MNYKQSIIGKHSGLNCLASANYFHLGGKDNVNDADDCCCAAANDGGSDVGGDVCVCVCVCQLVYLPVSPTIPKLNASEMKSEIIDLHDKTIKDKRALSEYCSA